MIPKIIHYCWFGGAEKPKLAKKCIKSWKKYCKGYQIIEWNENNFDIWTAPKFVQDAYKAKKWAFVTDYVRLKVVYDNGGVYFDTDVQLIKKIDNFLQYPAFFGIQPNLHVATGLGFGAEKNACILLDLMNLYFTADYINNSEKLLEIACPELNHTIFESYGYIKANIKQTLINGIKIFPIEYFCPMDFDFVTKVTDNTISIHWFASSWTTNAGRNSKLIEDIIKKRKKKRFSIKYNLYKILGKEKYNKLTSIFKRGNK